MPLSSRRHVIKFVHQKLLFRLRRLAIIFIIITGIVIYEVSHHYIAAYLAVAGFAIGMVIGLIVAKRMHIIRWDVATSKAITRMDRIGIIILILYILFSIARHWIFSYWFTGTSLTAFTLSLASGAMFGRFYTTRQQIRKILIAEGILKKRKH